jgi:subtilisin family serine protease
MSPSSHASRPLCRRLPLITAAVLTPVVVAVMQAPAEARPERPATPETPSATHRVTLVTGDVVTVTTTADGRQIADAVGGVRMQESGGDLYVVPDEAVGLLGADKLDAQLFNVTDLIEMGYDEAGTGTVPMIATYTRAKARAAGQPSAPRGSTQVRALPAIDGAALTAVRPEQRTFWTTVAPEPDPADPTPTLGAGVDKLWLDGRVQVELKESVPQIGAPDAWAAGYDGSGVTVAVLDTGIDANHPDLATQIDDTASFVPEEGISDVNGHGTHVASTIVGTGAASDGDYKGVAPGADLIVGKVLGGADGFGQDSWVMAGMAWAAQSGAEVVSMSLGDTTPSDGSDPMSQMVDSLSDQYGTLFVIASGNAGPESISAPGAAASALTVGAVDKQDNLAGFSSTGPLTRSGALKPDLVAPGVDITAARSQEMTDGSGMYWTISGTSMATPHVSGAAAILAQEHDDWTGRQLKEHLMSSAKGLADWSSPFDVGTGRLDVAAAVNATVRSTGSLLLGNFDWPHEPSDVAVTKDITFTNDGPQDVTLDLALTATGGAFTMGAATVTVPAGGKATVPVTGDPQAVDFGRHVGYVIGTDTATGLPVTRTSVALIKESERYDFNIKLVDRDGEPAAAWVAFNIAGDPWPWAEYVDGEKTLRMPPGNYSVTAYLDVQGDGPDRSGLAVMVDPETVLDQSAEVVLDARDARLVQTDAPGRLEDRQRKVDLSITDDASGMEFRSAYVVPPAYDDIYVSPTDPITQGSFMLTTRVRQGEPMLSLDAAGGVGTFDTIVQPGSALQTDTDTVRTVYAGNGGAADYAGIDAAGAIAVVDRSDEVTPKERADAAVEAGALMLIVVNDGVGGLNEFVGSPDGSPATIPVASVHRDAGAELVALAQSGTKMTATRKAYTDVVYDLTREYPGFVPDHPLVYQPRHSDLARIDASYYAVKPGAASGYRYDLTLSPSLGFEERERHPRTRVEWVTPGQEWVESHAQNIEGELPWPMVSGVNAYAKGKTTRLDWFRPAVRPGFSDSFGVYNSRWQNFMTWNVQVWSSFSDVMRLGGFLPWGETPTHLQVFQGKELIHDNKFSADMQWVEVPAGNHPYRVVLDASRPADVFRLSTRTHTEWRYRSDTVDSDSFEPFSVMKLDYRLDTNLKGNVKAGKKHRIAVRSGVSDFGTLPGKLAKTKLYVSYNGGGKWHKVTLTKGKSGWWRGAIKAPKKPGGFISVKASATMDSGYAIKQEIIRAYGLR